MKTLKEKQDAVMTLMEDSILLSYGQKLDIVDMFPVLTEIQLDALGGFLATEEQLREEYGEDIQRGVEKVLSEIVGEQIVLPADDNRVFVGVGKPSSSNS